MRRRAAAVAGCAAAMLAAAPGVADARTFRGKTSQSRSASLVSDASGVPTRVRVSWVAKCDHGTFTATTLFAPPRTATATRARETRTYTVSDGAVRLHITAVLGLQRVVAGGVARWSGTFIPRVVVRRAGRTIDHCRAAPVGVRMG